VLVNPGTDLVVVCKNPIQTIKRLIGHYPASGITCW